MISAASNDWIKRFPALQALDDPTWHSILASARLVEVPAGTIVFHDGDPCRYYMLVLEGSVRVQKVAENGREITLYRVRGGDSCVLTTSSLLAGEVYPAEGIAETAVTAVTIPLERFQEGLATSPGFRRFIFASYGQRISSLIMLIEEVAFGRLDSRLAQRLLERGSSTPVIEVTHQVLAAELGTAREVVSRQLKELEHKGCVRLHRGRIELLDLPALRRLAGG